MWKSSSTAKALGLELDLWAGRFDLGLAYGRSGKFFSALSQILTLAPWGEFVNHRPRDIFILVDDKRL